MGTILESSRHLSGSASSSSSTSSSARGQLGNSRQGPALASGGASSGGEASSQPSCEPGASGDLLGGTTAREGAPAGPGGSKEVSGQGGLSAVRPACSFLSPLGSALRAGEGDFNTGSVLGFSSGEKEKGRITRAQPCQSQRTLPPPPPLQGPPAAALLGAPLCRAPQWGNRRKRPPIRFNPRRANLQATNQKPPNLLAARGKCHR